jgi:hypothetical protein
MVSCAGLNIPPGRMFWMGAGEKTTDLNAYVTGIGASKRIVVWDTTIAKMNTPQIVFVAGHEMGHYVVQHIPKGLAFFAVLLLVAFYVGYRCIGWLLARCGSRWRLAGLGIAAGAVVASVGVFVCNKPGRLSFQPVFRAPGGPVRTGGDARADAGFRADYRAGFPAGDKGNSSNKCDE